MDSSQARFGEQNLYTKSNKEGIKHLNINDFSVVIQELQKKKKKKKKQQLKRIKKRKKKNPKLKTKKLT